MFTTLFLEPRKLLKSVTPTRTRFVPSLFTFPPPKRVADSLLVSNLITQGSLRVSLKDSESGKPIDDAELKKMFSVVGEVKLIKPQPDNPECVFVSPWVFIFSASLTSLLGPGLFIRI